MAHGAWVACPQKRSHERSKLNRLGFRGQLEIWSWLFDGEEGTLFYRRIPY